MTPQHVLLSEYLMKFDDKIKGFHPQFKKNSDDTVPLNSFLCRTFFFSNIVRKIQTPSEHAVQSM